MIHVAVRDMSTKWSPEAYMFDASHWGAGVMSKTIGEKVARDLGRHNERWRFKKGEEESICFRDEILVQDGAGNVESHGPLRSPPVPDQVWRGSWKRVISVRWSFKAAQVVLEGHAFLRTCRHLARNFGNFGRHHLVLAQHPLPQAGDPALAANAPNAWPPPSCLGSEPRHGVDAGQHRCVSTWCGRPT